MAKALISKADLERIALQEIRSFPGSEHVISVEVECESSALTGGYMLSRTTQAISTEFNTP